MVNISAPGDEPPKLREKKNARRQREKKVCAVFAVAECTRKFAGSLINGGIGPMPEIGVYEFKN